MSSRARGRLLGLSRRLYNSPLKHAYHRLPLPLMRLVQRGRDLVTGDETPLERIPHVYPVLQCNLRCSYCANGQSYDMTNMGYSPLPPDQWVEILDALPGNAVIFTGGEPTLYRGLPEVINRIAKTDVRVYTNLMINVDAFMGRLEKPVTFFTSFHPGNPGVTFERIACKLQSLLAHPMCRDVYSHHLIKDASNGSESDFEAWRGRFAEIGVELLLYDNQYEVNASGSAACAYGETRTVDCAMDRVILGPNGRRYICVSKMIRRMDDGLVPLHEDLPRMICHEYGLCSPCDEVAIIRPAPSKRAREER